MNNNFEWITPGLLAIAHTGTQADKNSYVITQFAGDLFLAALFLLVVALIIFFALLENRSKEMKLAKENLEQLQAEYQELAADFDETSMSNCQLTAKYEEMRRNQEKIKKLAYTDYLTELPNRVSFTEMLDSIMLTLRNEEIIGIMDVDIDNFKNINDTLGHSYGDELLIDVTHRLKQAIDEDDYLARIGGDEFIILTQNITDSGEYENKVKKIQKVFSYPFVLAMKEYFITVSIGITMAPQDGKTTQVLVKNVDSAMYAAKDNGKNTYSYFNNSMNEKFMMKIQMQSELRKALENQEFMVYYQPLMDLDTDRIAGFEALVRWNHPTNGVTPPMEFIPLAEETGLIVPIGNWVLREACKQLKSWEDEGYDNLIMAVNISIRQFRDKELFHTVEEAIQDTGINPEHLELEITESIALENIEYSVATIRRLKDLGIRFSLDDFGTGYSSLNYLKLLPVDNLKIDKSFLDTILEDFSDQKIVKTIINLAQVLDLVVIAEGVEKAEQESFLKKAECNKAQGYLYSMPLPKEEAEEILRKSNKK